jgi:hypothetical protein
MTATQQSINNSLEKEFLQSLKKNTMMIQVGCRHSGKTTWAMSLLAFLLQEDNFYHEFHLVLPTYSTGQTGGTFDWLDRLPEKLKKKITIYCDFSLVIVERLIEESDGKTNRFFYVDDATAEQELFSQSDIMRSLSSKARHYKITTMICLHFMKLRNTLLRCSAEWLIIHRMTDNKVLENIYDESASLFWDKKQFIGMCRDEMLKDYPSILIWRDKGLIDCGNGMDYSFQNKYRDKVLNKVIVATNNGSKKQVNTLQTVKCDTEPAHRGLEPVVQEDKGQEVLLRSRKQKHRPNTKSRGSLKWV